MLYQELLNTIGTQLRPIATVSIENPTLSNLEKELIAEKQSPAVVCAVAVLLCAVDNSLQLTLIQRPAYEGVHGGQISFAGGKKDNTDTDLLHTALRECKEELGVEATRKQVLGALPDIYIVPSHAVVTPFVVFLPQKPVYTPNQREVAKVLEFDFAHFLKPDAQTMQTIKISATKTWKLPCYVIADYVIWGATARMIQDLTKLAT
jgi:8-oxo-dGTP pyrophosphatase MutT (NUDIX family)